jgi:hypothetical protein
MQAELIILNAVIYATLAIGLAVRLKVVRPIPVSAGESYKRLGAALSERFPDLPAGFTLREGLARAEAFAPGLDWGSLKLELNSYEAYRFGGASPPSGVNKETLRLVRALRRRWR